MFMLANLCWLQVWKFSYKQLATSIPQSHISGEMVSMHASSATDWGFETRSGQTKGYEIGICYFSTKHAALSRKSKDWLTQNQDNVSEWGDMWLSIHGLLFQWLALLKNPTKCVGLVSSHWNFTCSSPWYSWKIADLALSKNHSLNSSNEFYFWHLSYFFPWYRGSKIFLENYGSNFVFNF